MRVVLTKQKRGNFEWIIKDSICLHENIWIIMIETPNNNEICCELRHIFSQKFKYVCICPLRVSLLRFIFHLCGLNVPSHNNNSFEILAREFKTIFGFLWSRTWPFWCDCDQSKNGHLECDFTFSTLRVQMYCNVTFAKFDNLHYKWSLFLQFKISFIQA